MNPSTFDWEERTISLSDVKRLYITHRKKLIRWAFLGGALAFLYFGTSSPQYKAEASFKEAVEKGDSENILKEIMQGMGPAAQPQAASLMESFQVLRLIVEKMGLQVHPDRSEWAISRWIKGLKETWRVEKGLSIRDPDPFVFQNTFYEGEGSFQFQILFSSPDEFTLHSPLEKREIGKGRVGVAVELQAPLVRFTLAKTPQSLQCNRLYPFRMNPWSCAAREIQKKIKISHDKLNRSLIRLSFQSRDRHLAAEMINELMQQYQNYLKREYDHTAKAQLTYLENRQEQICGKIEDLFDEYGSYLKENLKNNGFVGLGGSLESLLGPHHRMQQQLLEIETGLARLDQVIGERKDLLLEEFVSDSLNEVLQKMQELKQERDLLELSLFEVSEESLQVRKGELQEIRGQRLAVAKLLQEMERGGEISALDAEPELSLWASRLDDAEEKEDFAEYLENYLHLLSLREKMLHERFFYGSSGFSELQGIDLSSAKLLFLQYNGQLDAAEAQIRHYQQFQKEMQNPGFDLSSLSSVLPDPLCQKIIAQAGQILLQLKDEHHRTSKEAERWKEEMSLQRKVLSDQLNQLQKVAALSAEVIREKMKTLQKISVDCINQQLSVLHEQVVSALQNKRQGLVLEKTLLQTKMEEIRNSLAKAVPEKWKFEQWIAIKTEMITKMMKTITEVVETKSITNHLHHVESKPLDNALVPTQPELPHLYRKSFLGALGFACLIFLFLFIQQLLKGFPVTFGKLQALKLPVLGLLSSFCDGRSVEVPKGPDLDLLRRLAIFTEKGKVVGLIEGRGPDYSYAFCENLARMSVRSIVVRCDFHAKFRKEEGPGLLQIYQGDVKELPIQQEEGFDLLSAGGFTPFGMEIMQSDHFTNLLENLKKNYDRVFLLLRSSLSSAESIAALKHCDRAVVTICEELTEELTPFVDWAYHEGSCRLTFIACS